MQSLPLAPSARGLIDQLQAAESHKHTEGQVYHVASIGAGFYFAYEQLRNVAEYRERHLLLRSAIERFLVRDVRLSNFEPVAADLVTELTHSGYLKNDTIAQTTLVTIDAELAQYSSMYHTARTARLASAAKLAGWIYQTASVQVENLLVPDPRNQIFMQYSYEHFLQAVDKKALGQTDVNNQHYRISMYCAVQRAIFKSDMATTRHYCVAASLPDLHKQPIEHFVELNKLVDALYQCPPTNRIFRLINRHAAPMRIMREYVMNTNTPARELFANREETISKFKSICLQQYSQIEDTIRSRVGKAILFILITKTIIGVSIEVPYDLARVGEVAMEPLLINILFPLLYMASIGARISTPSRQNTEVIADYLSRIIYDGGATKVTYKTRRRVKSRSLNASFSIVYAVGFTLSIALMAYILSLLHFNLISGIIFFVFFSAVSFLGFRLRQSSRELEMIDERQGLVQTLIDFLSAPFVHIGHWLSDKYAKANFVTLMLDFAIEMPLKTSLRFIQQWVGFIRDKQEEL